MGVVFQPWAVFYFPISINSLLTPFFGPFFPLFFEKNTLRGCFFLAHPRKFINFFPSVVPPLPSVGTIHEK